MQEATPFGMVADGHLPKPFDLDDLLKLIEKLIGKPE